MEIHTSNPVSNQAQGLESAPKASEVKREKEDGSGQQAAQAEENPDYRVSLSDESKNATGELTGAPAPGQVVGETDLSEEDAAQVAQQASVQLAQTNASISNQVIQKAVDLFT